MPSFVLTINCADIEELMETTARLGGSNLKPLVTNESIEVTSKPAESVSVPANFITASSSVDATGCGDRRFAAFGVDTSTGPDVTVCHNVATGEVVDLDSAGLPWDERIHASSKETNQDGTWRYRRNIRKNSPGLIEQVEAELRGPAATPLEQAIAVAPQAPTTPAIQAPVAPTVMAPVQPLDPQTVTTAIAPTPAPVMPTPTALVEDPLTIPAFLLRTPEAPAAQVAPTPAPQNQTVPIVPQVPQAPTMPAPEALASAAPAPTAPAVDYVLVVNMLTNACKPGPNNEPPRMTDIAAFNAQLGIAGIADLASDPAKVMVAYQKLLEMGIR